MKKIIWILLALGALVVALNWQTLYRTFAPPKPVLLNQGSSDLSATTLTKYAIETWADVRNDGGDGVIAMEATLTQGDKVWTHTTTQYFKSLETARMNIVFKEPTLWGAFANMFHKDKDWYRVRVFAYGK